MKSVKNTYFRKSYICGRKLRSVGRTFVFRSTNNCEIFNNATEYLYVRRCTTTFIPKIYAKLRGFNVGFPNKIFCKNNSARVIITKLLFFDNLYTLDLID